MPILWFMLKLPCKLNSTVIWIVGCILKIAGSKLVSLGSKTQILHHRLEETRHKWNNSLIASLPINHSPLTKWLCHFPLWNGVLAGLGPWCNPRAFLATFINRKTPKHRLINTIYIQRFLIMKIVANLNMCNEDGLWKFTYEQDLVAINLSTGNLRTST